MKALPIYFFLARVEKLARRKFNLIDLVLFAPAVAALVKSMLNA